MIATTGLFGWFDVAVWAALGAFAAWTFTRVRGTTLAAPAVWSVAAAAALVAAEAYLTTRTELEGTLRATLIRYGAAAATFCPTMAVLGAKRPQDRGWQWVVLSLGIVLLAPAGQAWAARGAGEFQLSPVWKVLLYALIGAGILNYGPTRWAPTAALLAVTQGALTLLPVNNGRKVAGVAALALLAAAFWQTLSLARKRTTAGAPTTPLEACTRRWLVFRDGWGAFWGLRILHRINETAELSAWPVRLTWAGFAPVDGGELNEIPQRVVEHVEQTMDSLLRRFERLTN